MGPESLVSNRLPGDVRAAAGWGPHFEQESVC